MTKPVGQSIKEFITDFGWPRIIIFIFVVILFIIANQPKNTAQQDTNKRHKSANQNVAGSYAESV